MAKGLYLINPAIAWYRDSYKRIVLIDTSTRKEYGLTKEGSEVFKKMLKREYIEHDEIVEEFIKNGLVLRYDPEKPKFFSPGTIAAEITWRCNLKCKHCYVGEHCGISVDWSMDMFRNFIEGVQKLQVKGIALGGGEPLLHPLFEDFLKILATHKILTVIVTNGTVDMEKYIPYLKTMDSKGNSLFRIAISIDGPKEIHDIQRGVKGAFDKTLENIATLGDHGIHVNIQYTISQNRNFWCIPQFFSELKDFFDYINTFGFKIEYPVGRGESNIESFPTPEEYKDMRIKIRKWASNLGVLNKLSNIGYFPPMFQEIAKKGWRRAYYLCSAGIYQVTLDAKGVITPCTVMRNASKSEQYNLGNIKSDDLYEIWHTHPVLWNIRFMWPNFICSTCAFVCSKCPAVCLAIANSLDVPDPRCPLGDVHVRSKKYP